MSSSTPAHRGAGARVPCALVGVPDGVVPDGGRWAIGLLARLDQPATDPTANPAAERGHRILEADFVGDLLVSRIDPPMRLSPRSRREAGDRARAVGEAVRYSHLWALDDVAYLYAAEGALEDETRWLAAVGGVGLHRYRRWHDERAHFEDTTTWARELRAAYGSLLSDLYEVTLHDDPAIFGGIAARLGLRAPSPTRPLWEIAFPRA